MRSNAEAFYWLEVNATNAERREYPITGDSAILAMSDIILRPPYLTDPMHSHNCMEIGLCIEGRGVMRLSEQEECTYEVGTVIIIPEGVHHCTNGERMEQSRWRYIAVNQEKLMEETTKSCRAAIERLIRSGVKLIDRQMRSDAEWLIQRMFEIKCGSAQECVGELEALLLLILMRSARDVEIELTETDLGEPVHTASAIEPALLYIAEQYRAEIKIAQLARSCAMSESYFRKSFVSAMGMAPAEYLNRYRIERAVHLLKTRPELSVSQIAGECGYSSIATFNRNFLRYMGVSPSELKHEHLHKAESEGT